MYGGVVKNAIEYEVKFDRGGRLAERRLRIGPVLITTVAGLILALTGHTIWNTIVDLLEISK